MALSRDDFHQKLEDFHSKLMGGVVLAWTVLHALEPDDSRPPVPDRLRLVWIVLTRALQRTLIVELAKIYDPDARAISLQNLVGIAKRQAPDLLPHAAPEEVKRKSREIAKSLKDLKVLIGAWRNKHLAHLDEIPGPLFPVDRGKLWETIREVVDGYRWLAAAHGVPPKSWDDMEVMLRRQALDLKALILQTGPPGASLTPGELRELFPA